MLKALLIRKVARMVQWQVPHPLVAMVGVLVVEGHLAVGERMALAPTTLPILLPTINARGKGVV